MQKALILIGSLVVVVSQFVVNCFEIFGVDLDTHFDTQIIFLVYVPGRSMADDLAILGFDVFFPSFGVAANVRATVADIDFSDALLEGMLGLLLFAGALHVKIADLHREWVVVMLMATIGIGLSTAIVGFGFSWLTGMPLIVALVFGSLISPTDPVAVLGVLREANLEKSLETKIAGESLFNDGVAYVVFLILIGLAFPSGEDHGGGFLGAQPGGGDHAGDRHAHAGPARSGSELGIHKRV